MAVFGTPSYDPYVGFAFPRAYMEYLTFGFGVGALFSQTDENFYVTDGTNPDVHVVANFYPPFWSWSSNRYTFGFILIDWWVQLDSTPGVKYPLNFTMYYEHLPVTNRPGIFIAIPGWTHRYTFQLPPRDEPYWLPDGS